MTPPGSPPEGGRLGELRAGWRTLAGATLGMAVGASSLPFYTAGVFVPALEKAFGWSRTQISLGASLPGLGIVVCAPFVGLAVDRWGVRGPAAVGLAGLGTAFLLLSGMNGVYGLFFAIQLLLPFIAGGSTPVAFTRAVSQAFLRARGLALGISVAGIGVMATVAPVIVSHVIDRNGWRAAYLMLAAVVFCAIPLVLFLMRGRAPVSAPASGAGAGPVSMAAAVRTPVFRRLAAVFFILALGVCGYVLHLVPMLRDGGVAPGRAAAMQGLLGASVLLGRLATGALIDRIFAPSVAAAALAVTALGLAALAVWGAPVAAPAAVLIGFALGAEVDLIGYLTAAYFGLALYGRLYGLLYSAFGLGVALSPLLISGLRDATGGYGAALWLCAGLIALAALLFATAPPFPQSSSTERVGRREAAGLHPGPQPQPAAERSI